MGDQASDTYAIVGGGLAGGTAALTLRKEGFEGRVVLICGEDHPPYNRPPLSKAVVRGELAPERTQLRPPRVWESNEIDLLVGRRVTVADIGARRLSLDDGSRLGYDKLLLATGGRARALPGAPLGDRVRVLRTLEDALVLRELLGEGRSLAVVGAGFIGAELAASARSVGTAVTLFEAGPLPLPRLLPPSLGDVYARLHRQHGVDLRTGSGISRIEPHGSRVHVFDGAGGRVEVDAVVVAVGLEVEVELARAAGLDVHDGVVVDESCRTSAPDVYAAGDIAHHPNPLLGKRVRVEHFQNAQHQAAAAACNMLGAGRPFAEVPWVWSDQYDVRLEVAGIPAPSDEVVVRGEPESFAITAFLLRDGALAAVVGLNRPDEVRTARSLIGRGTAPPREQLAEPAIALEELVAAAERRDPQPRRSAAA